MQPSITSSSRSAVYNSGIDVYAVHFVDGTRDRIFRVLQQFRMEAERACCTILILAERRDLLDVDVSIVLLLERHRLIRHPLFRTTFFVSNAEVNSLLSIRFKSEWLRADKLEPLPFSLAVR